MDDNAIQPLTRPDGNARGLFASLAVYRDIFSHIPTPLLLVDAHTFSILNANPAACDFYGWSFEELTSRNVAALSVPPLEQVTAQMIRDAQGKPIRLSTQNRLASGEIRDVELSFGSLPDDGPAIIIAAIQDVTDATLAARKVKSQASLLDQVHNAVITIDFNNTILSWNKHAEQMYQWTSEEAVGKSIIDLLAPEEMKEATLKNFADLNRDGHWEGEYNVRRKDGSSLPAHITNTYLQDAGGSNIGFIGISVDITERRRAEQALRESESLFRVFFENAAAGFSLVAPSGRFMKVNQKLCEITGYPEAELLALTFNDITVPEDRELGQQIIKDVLARNLANGGFEKRYYRKDGRLLWVYIAFAPVFNADRQLLYFVSTTLDITERKLIEEELRKKSRAVESSPLSIVISDVNGNIEYVNPRFSELTGYSSEEVIGHNPRILQSGYTTKDEYARLWDTILSGQVWKGEFRNRKKNGDYYWENASISPIPDESGRITHFVAVKENITERKRDQQRISETLAFNQTILDSSPIGIVTYSSAGDCLSANPAAALITGIPLEVLFRQNFRSSETWEAANMIGLAEQALETNQPVTAQVHGQSSAGREIWLNVIYVTFKTGDETNLLFMFEDDSLRQKAEAALQEERALLEQRVVERTAELRVSNLALEKALRTKDEFMAAMSHELRTPLTGILGLAQVLQIPTFGELTGKQKDAVLSIENSGHRLMEVITDVLEYTNLQSGTYPIVPRACYLVSTCQDALKGIQSRSDKRHQTTDFSIQPELIVVTSDEAAIRQILNKLLINASKFTAEGGRIGIDVRGDADAQRVAITVWDTGIGIRAEDFPRLFQPFVQLDASLSRQYEGTGLGLALVRQLSRLLGGDVSVESEVGKGSRFTVSLPWK